MTRAGQAADQVRPHHHALTGAKTSSIEMILQCVHAFIKHDGLRHMGRDDGALVERLTGLFCLSARSNAVLHADGGYRLLGALNIEGNVLAAG